MDGAGDHVPFTAVSLAPTVVVPVMPGSEVLVVPKVRTWARLPDAPSWCSTRIEPVVLSGANVIGTDRPPASGQYRFWLEPAGKIEGFRAEIPGFAGSKATVLLPEGIWSRRGSAP